MYCVNDDVNWLPTFEANPIDPDTSLCSVTGKGDSSLYAQSVRDQIMIKLSEQSKEGTKEGETFGTAMSMATDASELSQLVTKLALDDPLNPRSKVVGFDEAWKAYANRIIRIMEKTVDAERAQILASSVANSKIHPVMIMIESMKMFGDTRQAEEIQRVYAEGNTMPPKQTNLKEKGTLFLSGDSVFEFKKKGGSYSFPEYLIRNSFDWSFESNVNINGVSQEGPNAWRIKFNKASPAGDCILFTDIWSCLMGQMNDVMKHDLKLWQGVNPSETIVRPRIAILFWTINEGLDGQYNAI